MFNLLPEDWQTQLQAEQNAPYFQKLTQFIEEERQNQTIYPPQQDTFNAFKLCPFDKCKVVILGQDPYHGADQAHGLSFSVQKGIKLPPSLKNIYKELESDLSLPTPDHGELTQWAEQGVLMINAVSTVREKNANSHANKGWENFTDAVIQKLSKEKENVIFVLWGKYAQKKAELIDEDKHFILQTAHPSPFSARNGFFDSKPFSKINDWLSQTKQSSIDWQISNQQESLF